MSIKNDESPLTLYNKKYAQRRKELYKLVYIHKPHYEDLLSIRRGDESISSIIKFLFDCYKISEEQKLEKGANDVSN